MSVHGEGQELYPGETARRGNKRESMTPMTQHRNQYWKQMSFEGSAAVGEGSKGDPYALELPQQEHPHDHKDRQRSLLKGEQHFLLFADKAGKL